MSPPDLHPDVAAYVEAYTPRVIDSEQWLAIRPVVVDVVRQFGPASTNYAANALPAVTAFVAWARRCGRTWTGFDELFDPDLVAEFIESIDELQPTTEGSYRSLLRRIGRRVTTTAPWLPVAEPKRRSRLPQPYGTDDLDLLESAARTQRTAYRRSVFEAILAVGLGAGLVSRELASLRPEDIARDDSTVLVTVRMDREIPVRTHYADRVWGAAASCNDEFLIPGPPRASKISQKVQMFEFGTGTPPLRLSRLRNTWVVAHLTAGIPVPDLMKAMGVSSVTFLEDLLPYVPLLDECTHRRLLVGPDLIGLNR